MKGLPRDAEAVLVDAFRRLSQSKAWQEKYLKENNLTPYYLAPAEFARHLDAEAERMGRILREMGVLK